MKNVKLFCTALIAVRSVTEVNVFRSPTKVSWAVKDCGCFWKEAHRKEIIDFDNAESFALYEEGASFGLSELSYRRFLFLRDKRRSVETNEYRTTGEDYYQAGVALLKEQKCLGVLTKMENAL